MTNEQFFLHGLTAQSPGSSDSLSLEGGLDHRTLAMQNSPDFESIAGSSAEDPLPDSLYMQGVSRNGTGVSPENPASLNFSILQYQFDTNAPWTSLPKNSGVPRSEHLGSHDPSNNFLLGDSLASESLLRQRVASDSGYGSLPRKSVGIPSIYSDVDRSGETQSVIQPFEDFHQRGFPSETSVPNISRPRKDGVKAAPHKNGGGKLGTGSGSFRCDECKKTLKTPSELK
jgi:hypothetical protein